MGADASQLDTNLFQPINGLLGNGLESYAKFFYYGFGSIWTVLGVAWCCSCRGSAGDGRDAVRDRGARRPGASRLLNEILGTQSIKGVTINVRVGDGPPFPSVMRRGRRRAGSRSRSRRTSPGHCAA